MNAYLVFFPEEGVWKLHTEHTFDEISTLYAEVDAIQILRIEVATKGVSHSDLTVTDMTDADHDNDGMELERVYK